MVGFIGPDRGSWDTRTPAKKSLPCWGQSPSGARCACRRGVENSSHRAGTPCSRAHQLSSRRTWHAPECLSTPFRKGHGTRLGRGRQAAWATGSAESRCSWETTLQPAPGREPRLGVRCGTRPSSSRWPSAPGGHRTWWPSAFSSPFWPPELKALSSELCCWPHLRPADSFSLLLAGLVTDRAVLSC